MLFGVFSILKPDPRSALPQTPSHRHRHAYPQQARDQYIGWISTLDQPIVNGTGKLRVDDTIWKISGPPNCIEGTKMRVMDVDGVVLLVIPVNEDSQSVLFLRA